MVQSPIPILGPASLVTDGRASRRWKYPGDAVGVVARQVQVATHLQQLAAMPSRAKAGASG
jgi:hypothetical protein